MTNQYMQEEDDAILKTYNRYPVVLDHGDGAYLYDPEGKKYLDFSAGYAVSSLGYNNKEFNDPLKAQIDKMIHTSNLYYNTTCGKAGEDLKKITGMYKVFFTNSGGEAIEGAIKTARKYAYTKKTGRYEFIAMENSFHGRSMGAVALTGHKEYREPFEPVMPGVHFAIYNDLDSVKALVNDKTCAIILETIQGEGGMIPEFLGRLPIVFTLQGLDEEMMVQILKEPKNAILKQYQKLLALDEVNLKFDDGALHAIARKAMKKDTGARALRAIIEEFMLDIMYEIPKDDSIGEVTITEAYIEGTGGPLIELRSQSVPRLEHH